MLAPFQIELTREVRFSVDRDWAGHVEMSRPKTNSWAGWPSAVGIVPYLVLRATLRGTPQQPSGYLCNIKQIDDLLRKHAIPHTAEKLRESGWRMPAETLIREIWQTVVPLVSEVCATAPSLHRLELLCTPYLKYTIRSENPAMVYLTQQFEFSAAHRLHVPTLSAEENRQLFGKCNNPHGHGHNYFVDVTVAAEPDPRTGVVLPLPQFEQLVNDHVIDHLDHKHLNDDTSEFRDVNPSVENIARVIWNMLAKHVSPSRLQSVRVWETPKTCAEYRGCEARC